MTELIPIDKIKTEAYNSGFKTGVCTGELKAIVRIKKGVEDFIGKEQKLYDDTDGEEGLNFDNCELIDELMNIIKGVKQ